jgi:hypothetical protein
MGFLSIVVVARWPVQRFNFGFEEVAHVLGQNPHLVASEPLDAAELENALIGVPA